MQHFIASRLRSFGYAFRGWWYVLRSQRNVWLHVVISILVIGVAAWVGLKPLEWAVIVLTMAIVFAAEFLNTAIEAVVDLASPHKHPLAKVGKDVGAGAVLIAALAAVVVGALILGPTVWARLRTLLGPR
ncbi:MAG: diacylglycerol kinase family protein [Anaerolineales bacterium]|jgi:diacylglycerol kinase (ATP)